MHHIWVTGEHASTDSVGTNVADAVDGMHVVHELAHVITELKCRASLA